MRARLGAACCGVAAALGMRDAPPDVRRLCATAWCLHEILLRRLSLTDRALRLPEPPAADAVGAGGRSWQEARSGMAGFLAAFHASAAAMLELAGASEAKAAGAAPPAGASLALDASMADWLDGRLLHAVLLCLWQGRPLGPLSAGEQALLAELERHVQTAAAATGSLGLALPAKGAAGQGPVQPLSPPAPSVPMEERSEAMGQQPLLPVRGNELIDAVLGGGSGSDSGSGSASPPHTPQPGRPAPAVPLGSRYEATHHWHSGGGQVFGCQSQAASPCRRPRASPSSAALTLPRTPAPVSLPPVPAGKPITAAELDLQEDEGTVLRDVTGMSLEEMAACQELPRFIRRGAGRGGRRCNHASQHASAARGSGQHGPLSMHGLRSARRLCQWPFQPRICFPLLRLPYRMRATEALGQIDLLGKAGDFGGVRIRERVGLAAAAACRAGGGWKRIMPWLRAGNAVAVLYVCVPSSPPAGGKGLPDQEGQGGHAQPPVLLQAPREVRAASLPFKAPACVPAGVPASRLAYPSPQLPTPHLNAHLPPCSRPPQVRQEPGCNQVQPPDRRQ